MKARFEYIVTRLVAFAADTILLALAYAVSFALRFDFQEPLFGWGAVVHSFLTVWCVQFALFFLLGCHHTAWRRTSLRDVPRFALCFVLSAIVLALLRLALPSLASALWRPPYSISLIDAFVAPCCLVAVRFLWKWWVESRVHEHALLNRREHPADASNVASYVADQCVVITGAGGSIGSELVRQIAAAGARRIVLVERSENALYEIDRAIRAFATTIEIIPALVDIADEQRMVKLFEVYQPAIVLHAAAYKHVPMVEYNPREGLRNNALATYDLGRWARAAGVKRFILVSTDKAVHPAGVMGLTKRLAEVLLLSLNRPTDENATHFSAVRFGNVLGSSGSVVPLFREQIAHGGPLTVTHPDMRRYFMSVREAVSLVLQAMMLTGDLFTLDMGKSVRIVTLAEEMIRHAGFRPYVDIPIVFTGIRAGEKLFEELDVSEQSSMRTGCTRVYVTTTPPVKMPVADLLARLQALARLDDEACVRAGLLQVKDVVDQVASPSDTPAARS